MNMRHVPGGLKMLFIGDGGQSEQLPSQLAEDGVTVDFDTRHISIGTPTALRQLAYLGLAMRIVLRRSSYDKIFIWQQYIAVYYSLLSKLWPFRRRPYLVYYIISKKPAGLLGKIRQKLFLFMLSDNYNVKTYLMSAADYLAQAAPATQRKKMAVLNDFLIDTSYTDQHYRAGQGGNYVFGGGSGNRKYDDMLSLARDMPDERFVIACRQQDVAGPVTDNVIVRHDAYHDEFDRLILGSRAVMLSLGDPNVMSGQLVCMQAFAAGKVVFMTRNNFMRDWLPDADELPFLRFYDRPEECEKMLRSLSEATLIELGTAARAYYDGKLRETGFYAQLARDIAETPWG